MEITSWKQLDLVVNNIIRERIKFIGEQVQKALRAELITEWYDRQGYNRDDDETDYYRRTWQLLDSISWEVESNGNEHSVRIFYDTNKIYPVDDIDGFLPGHKSAINGEYSGDMLPQWIEEGTSGSPIYNMPATHVVGNLRERLKDDKAVLQWFVTAFERAGFKVEYKL